MTSGDANGLACGPWGIGLYIVHFVLVVLGIVFVGGWDSTDYIVSGRGQDVGHIIYPMFHFGHHVTTN